MAKPGTPAAMLERIRSIRLEQEVGDILQANTDLLVEFQKKQMMQGKNNKGVLFSPLHSENPWFKKPGAGLRYAGWKARKFPETPFDVPNFIITGYYHGSLSFSVSAGNVVADASASFAKNIDQEFNNSVLGLNDDSKRTVWTDVVREPLVHVLADKIGCDVV